MAVVRVFQHNDNSEEMTIEQFYAEAKRYQLVDSEPKKKNYETSSLSVGDLNNIQEEPPFMINPLFREGEIIIMSSETKVGKTLFAIDLSLMAASGESIDHRLTSAQPYKTLYFDTEMNQIQFDNRVKKLSKNYGATTSIEKNFNRECLRCHKLDISKKNGQQYIESTIKKVDAKLIVLDNLGGFLPYGAERNDSTWEAVSSWLKDLVSDGRTVLVVHHLNKNKEQRGTGKISDDVDLTISLEKPSDTPIGITRIKFAITQTRHLSGNKLVPFTLEYAEEDKIIRRSALTGHTEVKNHPQSHVSEAEISKNGLSALQTKILNKARTLRGGEYLTASMFKSGAKGRSPSTITNSLKELCKKELLAKSGTGSGTKYRLRPGEQDDMQLANQNSLTP